MTGEMMMGKRGRLVKSTEVAPYSPQQPRVNRLFCFGR